MRGRLRGIKRRYGVLLGNVGARLASLVSLFVATLLVARQGGPAVVGAYALLRVLPSLLAMVVSAGLPGAITYFLAGKHRSDPRLPSTIVAMAVVGGALGAGLWLAATPWLGPLVFADVPKNLVLLAAGCVITRLLVVTAKSCS